MTYIERAIKDAIKGGYDEQMVRETVEGYTPFLDPLFWQALGKARGWKGLGLVERVYNCLKPNEASVSTMTYTCCQWHNFIDHLAEGRTAESFFEEIYKT